MAFAEYSNYDGLGLAELVKKKKIKASELVEAAIERIERHNPRLNAVIFRDYDGARARARSKLSGSFAGVPMLLKDILGFKKGWPNRDGSRFVSPSPHHQDSTLVTRFEAAGMIALGRTNVPEFGSVPLTECKLYGPAHNPWNLEHSTGGSSGGSAAAVAAGIVPFAHANDGGGSIRVPASACGLVGLKPTRGRNPLGPVIGDLVGGLVAEHVVSRTVRDTAAVLDATSGPEPGDPYTAPPPPGLYLKSIAKRPKKLRIAFATKSFRGIAFDPEIERAVDETAKLCRKLGHIVEEGMPAIPVDLLIGSFMQIWAAGLASLVEFYSRAAGKQPQIGDIEGVNFALYQFGKTISATGYQNAWASLQSAARTVGQWHERYDVWLTPVLARPPIKLGTVNLEANDIMAAFAPIIDYIPFTALQNATGQPAISLPMHWSASGLPIGMQFVGRFGEEHLLLQLAVQIEKAQPWIKKRPPVWG